MAIGYKGVKKDIQQQVLGGKLKPGDRLPTGKELCDYYSVSNMTVDRALRDLVKEGLIVRDRQRGTRVADRGSRSAGAIALLIPTLSSLSTFPQLADGVQRSLQQQNFQLVLEQTQMDIDLTLKAVHRVVRDGVKGVLYIPATSSEFFGRNAEALDHLRKHEVPVVVAGHCDLPGLEWVSGVSSDHHGGAKTLVNHLVKCGHRRIGLFGDLANRDHRKIMEGYRAAMAENGLEIQDRWCDIFHPTISISNRVKQYVQVAKEVTAIVAIGDVIAAEAMMGLSEIDVRIPDDIALVGFGDHPLCHYLPTGLTTVHVQHKEEGELLAGMLLDLIRGNLQEPTRIELPCPLVVRQSCGIELKRAVVSG